MGLLAGSFSLPLDIYCNTHMSTLVDHERDWPPCKVVFFGLATNALNVRNNNNNSNNKPILLKPIVRVRKKKAHKNWSMVIPEKAAPVTGTTLRIFWPCAGGLSVVSAIDTQLRDPINSGLTRWQLTVYK